MPSKPLDLVEVRRLSARDQPIRSEEKPLSYVRTSARKRKTIKSDGTPTLIVPETKTISDDLKPNSEPELKPQMSIKESNNLEPQEEPQVADPTPKPLSLPKSQLGSSTSVELKPKPPKPSDKMEDPKPKQEPPKSVHPKSWELEQKPAESVIPKSQVPTVDPRTKPGPTSPEELKAIEQAVEDWFKTQAPAENPSDTKNWVI